MNIQRVAADVLCELAANKGCAEISLIFGLYFSCSLESIQRVATGVLCELAAVKEGAEMIEQ